MISKEALAATQNIINRTMEKAPPHFLYEVGDLLEKKNTGLSLRKGLVLECAATWIDKLAMWSAYYKILDLETGEITAPSRLEIETHYRKII